MIILNQPFNGQLGEILINKLKKPYNKFTIISAFAKNSGVLRLKPALEQFKSNGGYIEAFVGLDAHGTSYEALLNLYEICDELYVVHSENTSTTFHSKIYMLSDNEQHKWIAIGSNNLTAGGLWTNFESSACFDAVPDFRECVGEIETLVAHYKNTRYECSKHIKSKEELDNLLKDDYLRREIYIKMDAHIEQRKRDPDSTNMHAPHFGIQSGISLPRTNCPDPGTITRDRHAQTDIQDTMTISETNNTEYMWFETRSLTGGSRNILDLSKLGTVVIGTASNTRYKTDDPNMTLGGVAFFDIDPEKTDIEKSITVNYNGVDYEDCRIKFPVGESSNGSWRIQLNGRSATGQKIYTVDGAEWLRHKIIVFEKIRTDYYGMSVLKENEIGNLEQQSRFVSTNGSSPKAKKYGLL